ncbi:MFS transporter [Streptomyces sp. NPDC008163]|uniref:MFS transporter n=1 Tax=Streptomyces sp. NPDC008163 TaxID=3364818 RepID=UPI0036E4A025
MTEIPARTHTESETTTVTTDVDPPAPPPARKSRAALAALALGAFVIGTAELIVVGVLHLIADDLDITVGSAGLLVTAYALGIALGGPVVTALTIRVERRPLLVLTLLVFLGGNLLALLATVFGLLLAARALTGTLHGLFIGVATAVAAGLVPAARRGQAVSMVFGGIAVSTVLGVPLGTLVGQTLGWRAAFAGIIALSVLALVAVMRYVPAAPRSGGGGLGAQVRFAFAPRVLAVLGTGILLMGGQFTAFTYLAPFLEDVTGIPGAAVSVFLLIFGVASAAGTFIGGRLADHSASVTLIVGSTVLVLALVLLHLGGSRPVMVALALAMWGLVGFGVVPSLQLRVITLAGPGGDLAATLGASAVNAGIAAGSAVGGWALAAYGVDEVPLAALVVCALAVPATVAIRQLRPPAYPERSLAQPDPRDVRDASAVKASADGPVEAEPEPAPASPAVNSTSEAAETGP